MLALFTAALLAASVSGEITTAIWAFSSPNFENYTSVGSVLGSSSGRTTVEFTVANYINTKSSTSFPPDTFTLGGLTYVEYTATATIEGYTTGTLVVACSRANEEVRDATCMQSLVGTESSMSEYCSYFSRSIIQTTTYLDIEPSRSDSPGRTFTRTQTNDFRSGRPDWCANATAISKRAKKPTTFEEGAMATYALVLTAGTEKLTASATASGPVSETGSAINRAGGSSTTPTGSAVATGAAMSVYAPGVAGMSALLAFFL